MPSNDQVILDQILSQNRQEIADTLSESEFFELFSAEQILKDFDLSYDEIRSGIVAGGNDGGIDSVFLLINGELIVEDSDTSVYRKDITIDLVFIQSKRSAGFSEEGINKLYASTNELLDLSVNINLLSTVYNKLLLDIIKRFHDVYRTLASKFPKLRIQYFYASRGLEVHKNVERKAEDLKKLVIQKFSDAEVTVSFVGAPKMLELARRTPLITFNLTLAESPISSEGAVAFICLVKLKDYFSFITDEEGSLRRTIFEANVRDYQGEVEVNAGIQKTLKGERIEDFWWLNNGVTIICSKAMQSGKTITVENPYVVNGLQTSTEIYKYFKDANTEGDERSVQVKIVVTTAPKSWDRIISASNKQTNIPNASLHATEQIHRDIEDFLKPYQIYYDRRKNFYKNEGKPIDKIISIGQLAQAVMAIMLQRPNDARARPSSLLKRYQDYEAVFSSKYDLSIYQVCAGVLKKVEAFIKSEHANLESRDRNNVKFHLAMLAAMKVVGKERVYPKDMTSINVDQIDQKLLGHCLGSVYQKYQVLGGTDQVAKGPEFRDSLIAEFSSGATGG